MMVSIPQLFLTKLYTIIPSKKPMNRAFVMENGFIYLASCTNSWSVKVERSLSVMSLFIYYWMSLLSQNSSQLKHISYSVFYEQYRIILLINEFYPAG